MLKNRNFSLIATAMCFALALNIGTRCDAAVAALTSPEGEVGGQTFGGELGNTFTVLDAVDITSLGAFDSGADGITGPITTRLWRATSFVTGPGADDVFANAGTLLASTTFTSGSALGTGTGYVYQSIDPITLDPGVYVVSASSYNATDPNGNVGLANTPNTAVDGNAGSFVRFGAQGFNPTAGSLPTTLDGYWSVDPGRYTAASFEFAESSLQIIDNGDAGYSQTGFTSQPLATAYDSDTAFNSTANNGGFATWTFTGLDDGTYEIFASWDQDGQGNLTTAAPYSFTPLGGTGASTTVDQRSAAGPDADRVFSDTDGANTFLHDFQKIGAVTVKNGQIEVRLDAVAGGTTSDFVFADAAAIQAVRQPTRRVLTVDWVPAGPNGVGSTGTVDGVGVTVSSETVFSNVGATFNLPGNWTTHLATDDATGMGGAINEGAAIGTETISVSFSKAITDPLVFLNFLNTGATVNFGALDVTLLDSHMGALAVVNGESIVTMATGIAGSADEGFAVRLNGTHSTFTFELTSSGTTGFTIGVEVPAPAALPAGLALLGVAASRRRRRIA